MMSPHIYRQLAHERHRDLLLEADSSRLACDVIAARHVSPAGSPRPDRRAAGGGGQRGTRTLDLADVNRAL